MSHPNKVFHHETLHHDTGSVAHILFWGLIVFSAMTGFFLLGIF